MPLICQKFKNCKINKQQKSTKEKLQYNLKYLKDNLQIFCHILLQLTRIFDYKFKLNH